MAQTATAKRPKVEQEKTGRGDWIDIIHLNVGDYVNLETMDGIRRSGRMTSVRTRQIRLNGTLVEIPTELELNGDPTDTVDLARITRLDFPG